MKVIGSIIARLKRKQLPHKNLLPLGCKTILQFWIERPQPPKLVNDFVVSTENELIARAVAEVLRKLPELAQDDVSPIPVNLNVNFALCRYEIMDRKVEIAPEGGKALSKSYAAGTQTSQRLFTCNDSGNSLILSRIFIPILSRSFKFTQDKL